MRRFKILAGTTFLLLVLFAAMALGVNKNETALDSKTTASTLVEKKTIDPKLMAQHQALQKELQLAVKTYFEKAISSGDIIGAGVSIVKGDSILLVNGFGQKSVGTKGKVDDETVFRLGSLSKGLREF